MPGSVVVRRSLGRQLHALRLAARKSLLDVDATKIVSKTKLMVMEAGDRPIKVADVMSLCMFYNTDQETADRLAAMARHGDEKGWWEDYSDVASRKFQLFMELESAAERVFTYDSELLYGLLQTTDYHRAVFEADSAATGEPRERWIQLRVDRQASAFERSTPLRVTSVLNEAVLHRQVGSSKVMREQREHLLRLNRTSGIDIFVLPWTAGAHAAMSGPFTIIEFTGQDHPDVVHMETSIGASYSHDETRLAMLRGRAAQVRSLAVSIEEYEG